MTGCHPTVPPYIETKYCWITRLANAHRQFGLTARPMKNEMTVKKVTFLTFKTKNGEIEPTDNLVSKILSIPTPQTKKHIRSLLELVNFYSMFIFHVSKYTACLCELLANGAPNPITRSEEQERALKQLQGF